LGGGTTFLGGDGIDTVDYSNRTHGVVVTMGDGLANDGESGDLDNVGIDIECFVGSSYDDTITGSKLSNIITPGNGNDVVNAGDGDDTILASANANDGSDTINGGKGTDTVDYSARSSGVCVVLDGVSRSGSCSFTLGNSAMNVSGADSDLIGLDVENVVGTTSDDHLVGNSSPNVLVGLAGADWLEGKSGDDQLDANSYASTGGNTCNPLTLSCIGTVVGTCDCASAAMVASCSSNEMLYCGNDPLDIGSCALADPSQFVACWVTQ